MIDNSEKHECLGSFMAENMDKIRINPNALSEEAYNKFNIEDDYGKEAVRNFFNILSEEPTCPKEFEHPMDRIIEVPNFKTKVAVHKDFMQPKCPESNCNGVGFWSLNICPSCHKPMPDLAELQSFLVDNLDVFTEQHDISDTSVTASTTGKVIVRDDDVIVTDRDVEEVKKNIHKYMPR